MMRVVLVVAAVLLGMVLLGWITFRASSNEATITIEGDEIRQDTQEAVQEGKSMLREAKETLRERQLDEPSSAEPEAADPREPAAQHELEQREPVEDNAPI